MSSADSNCCSYSSNMTLCLVIVCLQVPRQVLIATVVAIAQIYMTLCLLFMCIIIELQVCKTSAMSSADSNVNCCT